MGREFIPRGRVAALLPSRAPHYNLSDPRRLVCAGAWGSRHWRQPSPSGLIWVSWVIAQTPKQTEAEVANAIR